MRSSLVVLLLLLGAACKSAPTSPVVSAADAPQVATASTAPAFDYAAIVQASDRDAADRALDAGRKPEALLTFIAVKPGMKVAEIGAGGGYTTELLARVVGDGGSVYAQNSPFILARFAEGPLTERLKKPVNARVVRLDREFADPFPADVRELDLVIDVLFYHDTVWMKVDRDAMNRAIFQALKPGGSYVIVDHSSAAGRGLADVETLHRIEESVLVAEIEKAGFRSVASADFLRNPQDARDWSASPRFAGEQRGTSDRFVLRFEKP